MTTNKPAEPEPDAGEQPERAPAPAPDPRVSISLPKGGSPGDAPPAGAETSVEPEAAPTPSQGKREGPKGWP